MVPLQDVGKSVTRQCCQFWLEWNVLIQKNKQKKTKQMMFRSSSISNLSCFAVTVDLFVYTRNACAGNLPDSWGCGAESERIVQQVDLILLCFGFIEESLLQVFSVLAGVHLCENSWSEKCAISPVLFLLYVPLYILTDVLSVSRRCVGRGSYENVLLSVVCYDIGPNYPDLAPKMTLVRRETCVRADVTNTIRSSLGGMSWFDNMFIPIIQKQVRDSCLILSTKVDSWIMSSAA